MDCYMISYINKRGNGVEIRNSSREEIVKRLKKQAKKHRKAIVYLNGKVIGSSWPLPKNWLMHDE